MKITSLRLRLPKAKPKTDYHPDGPRNGKSGFRTVNGRVKCGCGTVTVIGDLVEYFCPNCGYLAYRKHQLPGTPLNFFPKRGE